MTGRERIARVLRRQPVDRVPITEAHFWPETVAAWRDQGLPADADPWAFFELENATVGYEQSLRRPYELIEEADEWVIARDTDGVLRKQWRSHTGIPQPLEFPVRDPGDWPAVKAEMAFTPDRIPANLDAQVAAHHALGRFVFLAASEPCFQVWRLMGGEAFFFAFHDHPDLVCDIMDTIVESWQAAWAEVQRRGIPIDGIWISGDLAYKNGPWMSPRQFEQLVQPRHVRIADFFNERDLPVMWHCCGDVRQLVPFVARSGLSGLQPLEARAGNDVREFKPLYGDRLTFMGNIQVEKLSADRETTREEVLSKLTVAMEGGGYMFSSDHSVPPHVTFDNYSYAIELVKEHGRYD